MQYNLLVEERSIVKPLKQEQCPKLSFYFVHSQGAHLLKLCIRKLIHAPSQDIALINSSKNVHTLGANLRKTCTRPRKCARRVQGAPLISDTEELYVKLVCNYFALMLLFSNSGRQIHKAQFWGCSIMTCLYFHNPIHTLNN